jgi:Fe-Mn family superoxide dismutase
MKPKGGGEPAGKLIEAITKEFGSFDNFKKQFAEAGMKRFGSGWAWLVMAKDGSLFITSTANQDNPLMNTEPKQGIPLLCVDVWEHAYYLKYQNKRADYLNAFWNVVNWEYVQQRYEKIAPK